MSSESSSSSALALADGRRGAALRFDSLPDELLSIVLRHCCERVATVGALDQALQQRQRALLRRSVLATVRGRYGIGWDEATARPTALLLLLAQQACRHCYLGPYARRRPELPKRSAQLSPAEDLKRDFRAEGREDETEYWCHHSMLEASAAAERGPWEECGWSGLACVAVAGCHAAVPAAAALAAALSFGSATLSRGEPPPSAPAAAGPERDAALVLSPYGQARWTRTAIDGVPACARRLLRHGWSEGEGAFAAALCEVGFLPRLLWNETAVCELAPVFQLLALQGRAKDVLAARNEASPHFGRPGWGADAAPRRALGVLLDGLGAAGTQTRVLCVASLAALASHAAAECADSLPGCLPGCAEPQRYALGRLAALLEADRNERGSLNAAVALAALLPVLRQPPDAYVIVALVGGAADGRARAVRAAALGAISAALRAPCAAPAAAAALVSCELEPIVACLADDADAASSSSSTSSLSCSSSSSSSTATRTEPQLSARPLSSLAAECCAALCAAAGEAAAPVLVDAGAVGPLLGLLLLSAGTARGCPCGAEGAAATLPALPALRALRAIVELSPRGAGSVAAAGGAAALARFADGRAACGCGAEARAALEALAECQCADSRGVGDDLYDFT